MNTDDKSQSTFGTAAYGGENWSQRNATHRQELGKVWRGCG
ncbi:MAG: amidinotransferase, partial [Gammaproteobacteria bacterium]